MNACSFYEKDVETEEILKKIKINMDDSRHEISIFGSNEVPIDKTLIELNFQDFREKLI